jgi:pimeloyl-ACP methyl ester carboxylesterase
MIDDVGGCIDYDESGDGPAVVLVPGSCATAAAWRSVVAAWNGQFRCVTTSLLGYGGTAERRTAHDASIEREAEIVEAVVRRAGSPAHLVGHSFGGLVVLAVAMRRKVSLASLTILEAPAVEVLRASGDSEYYETFRAMKESYFAAFEAGDTEAVAAMVDFYGGLGTFAALPARVRAYAVETTTVNILDWASAYGFALSAESLAAIAMPTLVMWGGASHPAVQQANARLGEHVSGAVSASIPGASHFMISSHAEEVARLIAAHVLEALA